MSRILNRPLFRQIKQEHRGTGITSGLQYRQNYRVGGQVKQAKRGLVDGPGGYAGLNFNPSLNLGMNTNQLSLSSGVNKANTNLSQSMQLNNLIANEKALRENLIPTVDYSKYSPTALDTIGSAATKTLEEITTPTAGRTLGKKSEVATFVKNLGKSAGENKKIRKELDLLKETDAKKSAEAVLASAKGERTELKEESLSYATLANQFNIAGLNTDTSLSVAKIQANALPAETKNYNNLVATFISQGMSPEDASSKAFGMAYKTINSQLDFASTLIGSLASGDLMSAEEKGDAVMKAFQIMTNMGGSSFLLDKTQMQNIADILSSGSNIKDDKNALEILDLD